jgi:hypothetical protein
VTSQLPAEAATRKKPTTKLTNLSKSHSATSSKGKKRSYTNTLNKAPAKSSPEWQEDQSVSEDEQENGGRQSYKRQFAPADKHRTYLKPRSRESVAEKLKF